jgi:hypothetical protein
MSKRMLNMPVAAVLAAGAAALSGPASNTASAAPLAGASAMQTATGSDVTPVWYQEWGYGPFDDERTVIIVRRYHVAADDDPYYSDPYYYDRPYPRSYRVPYPPPPAYDYYRSTYDSYRESGGYYREPRPRYGSGDVAYCASRFRSYDPETGTFLGYDGLRHPCP